jgi:hypothetical protein
MRLPQEAFVTAIDSSETMIHAIWPGDVPGRRKAVLADWNELGSLGVPFNIVVGDGVLNLVPFPAGCQTLLQNIRRALAPSGLLLLRSFVQPEQKESPDTVLREMLAGRIHNFTQFELRQHMATQSSTASGVTLNDAYRAWIHSSDSAGLALTRTGWEERARQTLERWRDSSFTMVFPQLDELCHVLKDTFEIVDVAWPDYALGERCPVIALRAAHSDKGSARGKAYESATLTSTGGN